ncbi:pentapeptide repeat-containing protein [Streptomyces marincola]|uniref:pentapeptide repeat-containing protein n=1 Tax=Streptomyces marincola TaxID=2878388 RepID=UPI001CF48EA7|nr:pentapeptide repeat-containing protein [Streptomyces marincola]UCM88790.1 pentapeptide repeat-containing protein [Streptomyces marincola]
MSARHEPPAYLRADCGSCQGLCCVALPFAASADFPVDKPAGRACANLADDSSCRVHAHLRERGWTGCTVFDCFGAGQRVSRETFGGRGWRGDPAVAGPMFRVFPVVRALHELLWYVHQALAMEAAAPVHPGLRRAAVDLDRRAGADPGDLAALDVTAVRDEVNPLLLRAGELVRAGVPGPHRDHRGADLTGARLRGAALRGASLRGARFLGADLTGADLRVADVTGADFRDADLSGADLTGALFLTQAQLTAARGDGATRLPDGLVRPGHWSRGRTAAVRPARPHGRRSGRRGAARRR